jgi:hypothetical protein
MSSAFYPQGMNSYNNRLPNSGYKTWKGTGPFSNPIGNTTGHIRPLTNNDPGNVFPTGFGLPRPIKHFRKGRVITHDLINLNTLSITEDIVEASQINYNINRFVKSSNGLSLGKTDSGLISQLIDKPASFSIKENNINEINGTDIINKDCQTCQATNVVSSWYPITNLTEKPQVNVTNPLLCCNQQRKARRRVLPPSTLLKKNYYTTTYQYLFNRCQTYDQRSFNFYSGVVDPELLEKVKQYPGFNEKAFEYSKPGGPLSYLNLYVANCNPNGEIVGSSEINIINRISELLYQNNIIPEEQYNNIINQQFTSLDSFIQFLNELPEETRNIALQLTYQICSYPYDGSVLSGPSNPKLCKLVVYKPNNPQFAKQGGVSSSTRILKLNVDTISTAAAKNKKYNINKSAELLHSQNPAMPFYYKLKAQPCNKTCNNLMS